MQLTITKSDPLNGIIKLIIEPVDYEPKINKELADYRKTFAMKGFRPGNVPMGIVKKLMGKYFLAKGIEELVDTSLRNYFKEQKLNILGQPLPVENQNKPLDFEKQKEYEFVFEVGLAPDIELDLSKVNTSLFEVQVDDKSVEDAISMLQLRHGKEEKKIFCQKGDFVRCDILRDGKSFRTGKVFNLSDINEEDLVKFTDKQIEAEIEATPSIMFSGKTDRLSALLDLPREQAVNFNENLIFIIKDIYSIIKAELTPEFFKAVLGEKATESLEEFKEIIRKDLAESYNRDARSLHVREVLNYLYDTLNPSLPENFLKKWHTKTHSHHPHHNHEGSHSHEGEHSHEHTPEEEEKEFAVFLNSLRRRLILDTLVSKYQLAISPEEIKNYTRASLKAQYQYYNLGEDKINEVLESSVNRFLSNEENVRNTFDTLEFSKISNVILNTVVPLKKSIPVSEFLKMQEEGAGEKVKI